MLGYTLRKERDNNYTKTGTGPQNPRSNNRRRLIEGTYVRPATAKFVIAQQRSKLKDTLDARDAPLGTKRIEYN